MSPTHKLPDGDATLCSYLSVVRHDDFLRETRNILRLSPKLQPGDRLVRLAECCATLDWKIKRNQS
jgi:hypothetical protein